MNLSYLTTSNRLLYVLGGAISLLVFLTVILVVRGLGTGGTREDVTLEFWGVFDQKSAFDQAIAQFEASHPRVEVNYTLFSYEDYESAVIDALAAGAGPDVWMIHNTWLPKHGDKLRPMPKEIPGLDEPLVTLKDYQTTFADVVYRDLVANNEIYAMPLYIDTLALYYNKDLLNGAQIARPPRTWEEFNIAVETLTKLDDRRNILQAGAAIGSARNINRSSDLLMSLMIQSGVQMVRADASTASFSQSVNNQAVGERALQYYTDFTNPSKRTYTWNDQQHYSIDAFAEGGVAMTLNYAHQIELLKAKAPSLNFAIAPIPQLSDADVRTYANYWAPAVTNASQHPNEAWEFIAALTSKDSALTYLATTGRPAARKDIIESQKNDLELGVFAAQALSARSWHQIDNVAIERIFADMIDDVNFNRATTAEAIRNAESKVDVLMRRQR